MKFPALILLVVVLLVAIAGLSGCTAVATGPGASTQPVTVSPIAVELAHDGLTVALAVVEKKHADGKLKMDELQYALLVQAARETILALDDLQTAADTGTPVTSAQVVSRARKIKNQLLLAVLSQ